MPRVPQELTPFVRYYILIIFNNFFYLVLSFFLAKFGHSFFPIFYLLFFSYFGVFSLFYPLLQKGVSSCGTHGTWTLRKKSEFFLLKSMSYRALKFWDTPADFSVIAIERCFYLDLSLKKTKKLNHYTDFVLGCC